METKNKDFHLIRTNNGEWISDEYAICNLSKEEILDYEHRAKKCGLPLDVNAGPDGTYWMYKHQCDAIERKGQEQLTK